MTLTSDEKFEEKLICCLENDMRNLANLNQSTRGCQNLNFDGILLSKVDNVWTLKFAEELGVMGIKNNAKFEEELTCHFKTGMRNLTNFDWSSRKSKKIAL